MGGAQGEKAKKDSALLRGGGTLLSTEPMDGERRAACAAGLSLFTGVLARRPHSLKRRCGCGGMVDPVFAGFQVAGQGAGFGGSGVCGGEVSDFDAGG